jgi:hypothetical protein
MVIITLLRFFYYVLPISPIYYYTIHFEELLFYVMSLDTDIIAVGSVAMLVFLLIVISLPYILCTSIFLPYVTRNASHAPDIYHAMIMSYHVYKGNMYAVMLVLTIISIIMCVIVYMIAYTGRFISADYQMIYMIMSRCIYVTLCTLWWVVVGCMYRSLDNVQKVSI